MRQIKTARPIWLTVALAMSACGDSPVEVEDSRSWIEVSGAYDVARTPVHTVGYGELAISMEALGRTHGYLLLLGSEFSPTEGTVRITDFDAGREDGTWVGSFMVINPVVPENSVEFRSRSGEVTFSEYGAGRVRGTIEFIGSNDSDETVTVRANIHEDR